MNAASVYANAHPGVSGLSRAEKRTREGLVLWFCRNFPTYAGEMEDEGQSSDSDAFWFEEFAHDLG